MNIQSLKLGRKAAGSKGFTLVEVMFATAISAIIGLVAMVSFIEGSQLFRSNSTEMVARDKGSRAIRRIATDLQNAGQVSIYANSASLTGTALTYGSCAVLTMTSGSVAYYLYPLPSATNLNGGNIYECSNYTGTVNPASDDLLVSSVQDFEFRSDVSGSIRTAFKIGIFGYPTMSQGAGEPQIVRFTTSVVPRN